MKRRNFIELLTLGTGAVTTGSLIGYSGNAYAVNSPTKKSKITSEISADVVIAGGGLGGVAAALATLRNGQSVILTEETDWIGGQLTTGCSSG